MTGSEWYQELSDRLDFDDRTTTEVITGAGEIDCPECDGWGELTLRTQGLTARAICPHCGGVGKVVELWHK